MDEKEFLIKRIKELSTISYNKNITIGTEFLNLNELNIFYNIRNDLTNNNYILYGGYEGAERKILIFNNDNDNINIACLKIKVTNAKFIKLPSHRDYLGAILSIGIKRNLIGDIIIDNDCAYVFVLNKAVKIVLDNLSTIGRANVLIEVIDSIDNIPKVHGIIKTCIIKSLRIDIIIANVYNLSRSKVEALIKSQKVFINGKLNTSISTTLKPNNIISVRGLGRFIFRDIKKTTKKERIIIEYELFYK